MRRPRLSSLSASLTVLQCLAAAAWAVPAFPGATGPGAIATGGRGGDVYHVTNLNADKDGVVAGSFMYGMKNAPGAGRTIVFDVGGTIHLNGLSANDTLRFNWGNVTIAGQTAPGPGITIAGTGTKWTGTNVVLRNISVRPNRNTAGITFDSFSLQVKNSIVDHVSATWFTDEGISITDAGATSTVQYANISEGLHYGGHSFGSIIATEVDGTRHSFNHNLYAHLASRMPAVGSETGVTGAITEFSNNVLYNWSTTKVGYGALAQPSSTNFVGNYYINGYNSAVTNLFVADTSTKVYQAGNFLDKDRDATLDGAVIASGSAGSAYFRSGDSSAPLTYVNTPFAVEGSGPETRESAELARQRVVDYGGANWWARSPVDARIVNDVRNLTGRNITDLGSTQLAEWNTLMAQRTAVARPAGYDTDRDGMPDAWESQYGLNPGVANNNADFDADGFTDLEEYINDVAAWPAPAPLVWTGGASGRYALMVNWGNIWQPSRFDVAQISSGVAIVDAVGQDALHVQIGAAPGSNAELRETNGWIVVRGGVEVGKVAGASNAALRLSGGKLVVAGTISAGAGSSPVIALTGGTLVANQVNAAGFVDGLTNVGSTISPGDGAVIGRTSILGSFAQKLGGSLAIELGGASAANAFQQASPGFDLLAVSGVADLGGTLKLSIINGYAPAAMAPHRILSADSVLGRFNAIQGVTQANGQALAVTYDPIGVSVTLALQGDANLDGTVNFDDLLRLAANYNTADQTWSVGDFTGEGAVDFDDLLVLAANYNRTVSGSLSGDWALALNASVPEPHTLAVVGSCCGVIFRRRVKRT